MFGGAVRYPDDAGGGADGVEAGVGEMAAGVAEVRVRLGSAFCVRGEEK